MKKINPTFVIIGLFIVFSFTFSVLALRENLRLKGNLAKKQQELREAQDTYEHLEELRAKIVQQEKKCEILHTRVPENEREPLSLIKEIIASTSQFGLSNAEFSFKKTQKESGPMEGGHEGAGTMEGMMQTDIPHQAVTSDLSQMETQRLPFKMTFECRFPDLILFLDWLSNQERLISIEDIKIEREDKILPRQKITLQLVAYTFLNSL